MVFGACEVMRHESPGGKIMHAELQIGDSRHMLRDEFPESGCVSPKTLKGTAVGLYLYVDDADVAFQRALKAGAKAKCPMADMFWGDRCGTFIAPFGHSWMVATHVEDVPTKELEVRMKKFFSVTAQT